MGLLLKFKETGVETWIEAKTAFGSGIYTFSRIKYEVLWREVDVSYACPLLKRGYQMAVS